MTPRRQRERGRKRAASQKRPSPQLRAAPRRSWGGWILFAALVSFAGAVLIPGALGLYFGSQERAAYLHQQAVQHYQQALTYESENYTELAIAEIQTALKYDPGYQEAADKLRVLQEKGKASVTAVPTALPLAEQLFQNAQSAIARQQWAEALDALEELVRIKPDLRASEVKALLIQSYLNAGKESVAAGQVEQARTRFDSALSLDPTNAEAKLLRARAILYLKGAEVVNLDWQSAVSNFQQLYGLDPNFYDVKNQLLNASINYGDFASAQNAYCLASREYERAVSLGANSTVESKMDFANEHCMQAVTAPTLTPAPIVIATAIPRPRANFFVPTGRVDSAAPCEGNGGVSGMVRDARSKPIVNVAVQIYDDAGYHPAPSFSGTDGIYIISLGVNAGFYHLVVLNPNGTPASGVFNLNYPGGNVSGCHWLVDWTKTE